MLLKRKIQPGLQYVLPLYHHGSSPDHGCKPGRLRHRTTAVKKPVVINYPWPCLERERKLTSSNLFASRCSFTNWLMFPFDIHSDTIVPNSFPAIINPRSGNMFGCRRDGSNSSPATVHHDAGWVRRTTRSSVMLEIGSDERRTSYI